MPKLRTATRPPLNLALIDWLLNGQPRTGAEIAALGAEGAGYDAFIEFEMPGPDLAALWRQHRGWLLAEWQRRGGQGQPWGARFDAGGA